MPDDADAPPLPDETPVKSQRDEAPVGFWTDITAEIRRELKPPVVGFFAPTPNAPVQGIMVGDVLELRCANGFTMEVINKPEIIAMIGQKASARLGRPVRVIPVDKTARPAANKKLEQLLDFGRAHADIVKIRNNQ